MKLENLSRLRRTISGILALTMTAATLSVLPASADTPTETSRTYYGNGYEVRYDITGAWGEYQNIQVTLKNIGNEPIQNWALKYDLQGEVDNIWNGTVVSNGDDWSIVKNAGYNYEIKQDSSVSYGYIISGKDLDIPDSIELCSERAAVSDSSYSVNLSVDSDWGSGFTGNISIENLGDTPLEAWQLSFDTNFDLVNVWNADIIASENNSYTVSSTYSSAFIDPGKTVTFGFQGIKENDIAPELSNVSMNNVIINTDTTQNNYNDSSSQTDSSDDSSIVDSQPDDSSSSVDDTSSTTDSSEADSKPDIETVKSEDFTISAFGEYNADENAIDIEWYTNAAGEYEILASADNEKYDSLIKVKDFTTYRYHIDEDFDVKYFKVNVTVDNKFAESIPFMAVKSADGYSIEFVDSDGDQIPDIYEQMLGTDKDNEDTDNDGLTDYQEVYITGTDPAVFDSVTSGVADAAADCDGDGLSNITEINIGTEVNSPDSDGDGLTDGDEVNVYGTNPLKYDTDDDGICDGDEVALGLDPLSGSSDGKTYDKERKFEQHIGADSDIFAAINTNDNAFSVSMDITAAGYAESLLSSDKSGYANVIESDAVLGIVPEFEYEEGFGVDDVKLNFEIKPEYIENTNGKYAAVSDEFDGIKRLNVFKYFDDIDMLLPIETTYDIENNRVSTHVDELGTYCLLDMETWFEMLEVDPSEFETVTVSASPVGMLGVSLPKPVVAAVGTSVEEKEGIDIFFNTYPSNIRYSAAKEAIKTAGERLYNKYGTDGYVHIYVVDHKGNCLKSKLSDEPYAINMDELQESINQITVAGTSSTFDPWIKNYFFGEDNKYRKTADTFYFVFEGVLVNEGKYKVKSIASNTFGDNGIIASVVSNITDQHSEFASVTGGKNFKYTGYVGEDIADYIISYHTPNTYRIISNPKMVSGANYKHITLGSPITNEYNEISKKIKTFSLFRNNYVDNYVDTDKDGLLDLEEIRYAFNDSTDVISWDEEGNVLLPTIKDCLQFKHGKKYVESQLQKYDFLDNFVRILPVYSDPTVVDSDGDNVNDYLDAKPLKEFSDNYIIVDSFDYEPQNDYLNREIKKSNDSYSTITLPPENFAELCKPYLCEIESLIICVGGLTPFAQPIAFESINHFGSMPNASKMFYHYLENTGETYILSEDDVRNILISKSSNMAHFNYNLSEMQKEVESILGRNGQLYISTSPKCKSIGACYASLNCNNKAEKNIPRILKIVTI